jgi:hypothetical protein
MDKVVDQPQIDTPMIIEEEKDISPIDSNSIAETEKPLKLTDRLTQIESDIRAIHNGYDD